MDVQIVKPEPLTILLKFSGLVTFDGVRNRRYFAQSFMLTNDGCSWKIVSDVYRFIDSKAFA